MPPRSPSRAATAFALTANPSPTKEADGRYASSLRCPSNKPPAASAPKSLPSTTSASLISRRRRNFRLHDRSQRNRQNRVHLLDAARASHRRHLNWVVNDREDSTPFVSAAPPTPAIYRLPAIDKPAAIKATVCCSHTDHMVKHLPHYTDSRLFLHS